MSHRVEIPLVNTNEPEANLAGVHVIEGQRIEVGDLICTLETTKSTMELTSDRGGYVVGLIRQEGETVRAGELLCYIAESSTWQPPVEEASKAKSPKIGSVPQGLRITQPARDLAVKYGISLRDLPVGPMITESTILSQLQKLGSELIDVPESQIDDSSMLIYGCGGHGKAVYELINSLETYHVIGFLDDGVPMGEVVMGLPVLGGRERLAELRNKGVRNIVNAVGGIGNIRIRTRVFKHIQEALFNTPTILHPTAFSEPSAEFAQAVQVFPHAYIGSEATIGYGSIINTGAIVSHDCHLGEYVNLSPGCILAGEVQIGDGVLIGMGATVNLQVHVGAGARIGNGATVKSDVPENGIVRAGGMWPEDE